MVDLYKMEQLNACQMYLQIIFFRNHESHWWGTPPPKIPTSAANPTLKNLTNISKSSLQWLQVNLPFPSCWQFGPQPSAPFIQDCKMAHASTNLWVNGYWPIPPPDFGTGWCLHNTHAIVYKTPPSAPTRMALQTMHHWINEIFSYSTYKLSVHQLHPWIQPLDKCNSQWHKSYQPPILPKTPLPIPWSNNNSNSPCDNGKGSCLAP